MIGNLSHKKRESKLVAASHILERSFRRDYIFFIIFFLLHTPTLIYEILNRQMTVKTIGIVVYKMRELLQLTAVVDFVFRLIPLRIVWKAVVFCVISVCLIAFRFDGFLVLYYGSLADRTVIYVLFDTHVSEANDYFHQFLMQTFFFKRAAFYTLVLFVLFRFPHNIFNRKNSVLPVCVLGVLGLFAFKRDFWVLCSIGRFYRLLSSARTECVSFKQAQSMVQKHYVKLLSNDRSV